MRFMNDKHRTRNFTPSDDALILQQPATGIGIKTLATMLGYQPRDAHYVGLANLAFRWPSVMIMTTLSTRERSVCSDETTSTPYWTD